MSTIAEIELPAEEFALYETLSAFPNADFEVVRMVAHQEQLTPYVQVSGDDLGGLDEALEADPSVTDARLVDDLEQERLYRMEWSDDVEVILYMVSEESAAVVDMHGRDTHWQLRVLFPDRTSLSATSEFCTESDLTFTVRNIHELEQSTGRGGFGLSEDQYQTLVTAAEAGYFDVPREVTMDELAEHLGISQQAVSERLRRGHRALIDSALRPDESTIGD
ncbi:hypothetical protein SAMN04487948_103525 [Halogranum amylolyticum]|uniref:GAF and HTH_10 associated domain-containing protein n=1 Tax=Halogranum amylolyticum TaxID=660520 RepID=A0A1H8R6I4_9EURY|nr:helix-turn-helix domain-containing protein [Halogranum amylolyticum]SEO61992.1 hypothetical protein SAMN04487948_103525 [Halogranum amylolyticum]